MDFSELIKSDFLKFKSVIGTDTSGKVVFTNNIDNRYYFMVVQEIVESTSSIIYNSGNFVFHIKWTDTVAVLQDTLNAVLAENNLDDVITIISLIEPIGVATDMLVPENAVRVDEGYDIRSKVYHLPEDVLFIINESIVTAPTAIYQVVPIKFDEYQRLMSKPFKEPIKSQMWRLVSDSTGDSKVEIIPHSGDIIASYRIRYVRRPNPIILVNLANVYNGLTINGESVVTPCELNPITHRAILDRAVELAKAAYVGDLKSTVELNTRNE